MAFELGDNDNGGMNEINLIPLIDIMLVLMIIFLVTATVLNPTVPLDLPKTSAQVNDMPPDVIQVSINDKGEIFWDETKLSLDELSARFGEEVAKGKDPQVHLRADKEGKYDTVAQVLATASGAGLTKIAFVNE
ncbi:MULTISPECIES: biopolymer transporter ExbD [Moraxella]|uniref:Biopolymer transporter ExbD n=1 Tax=Moraxella lacunata TaxID=477 RepID=A0A1B8PXV8_MORLA|nr:MULTISPECIES: biopolymer transporter ExbD [Moraxella]MBE9578524.1 biopolymer transporter ExbD [Moraxella sp. K1664]MBE9587867.1 biopolymer transporter ExbD [Moraxella sp. K1630]MBE9590257.1 biopolymer transporter ExbD [Moraxella sp. K127]MBE9596043.1 biopolymer transporter ExbD [Moraxella sp. K2450]MDH9218337.1 biopolymer transporter ExbD [Moraxella lacunata]